MTVAPVAELVTQNGAERLELRNRCVQRFRGCMIIADSRSADRTYRSSMTQEPNSERDLDARLDEALEMTFPASDPVAVHSPDPPPRSSENREPVERA
jgi:hypothetical protein